ncbi:MAG: ABC transporter permease subunit [Candidatus Thermoplasmatota archaeon]|nr:ABC transporter permease subunit [Candidatus Thermoplasmatota archaeon]
MKSSLGIGKGVLTAVIELVALLVFLYAFLLAAEYSDKSAVLLQASGSSMGINQNSFTQFFYFLKDVFTGDWGNVASGFSTLGGFSVVAVVGFSLPRTLFLLAISLLVSVPIVVLIGIGYSRRVNTTTRAASNLYVGLGIVFPLFLVGAFLRFFLYKTSLIISTPTKNLPYWTYPTHITAIDGLIHGNYSMASAGILVFIIPLLLMIFFASTSMLQIYRSGILKSLNQGYLGSSSSLGLPRWIVVRNYLMIKGSSELFRYIPLIMTSILTFDIVVEAVMTYRGLGWAFYESILTGSYFGAIFALFVFGVIVIIASFVSGIIRVLTDPEAVGGE